MRVVQMRKHRPSAWTKVDIIYCNIYIYIYNIYYNITILQYTAIYYITIYMYSKKLIH